MKGITKVEYLHPSTSRMLLQKYPDTLSLDFDHTQSAIWSPLPPQPHRAKPSPSPSPKKQQEHSRMPSNNSAFDFSPTKSPMWSPLVPRGHICLITDSSIDVRRTLSQENWDSGSDGCYSQSTLWSPLISPRGGDRGMLISCDSLKKDVLETMPYQEKIKRVSTKIRSKLAMGLLSKKGFKKGLDRFGSSTPSKKSSSTPKKGWSKVLKVATKQFKKQKDPTLHVKLSTYLRNADF